MSGKADSTKAQADEKKRHESDLLDEGLEETFPASDPPAMTTTGHADPKGPGDENDER